MLTQLLAILALSLTLAAGQGGATLRVRVVLAEASGLTTPIPRLVLLVSENPPTDEPRRVRTNGDGTIELKLAPGSYLVESDEPVSFRGKAYTWTQIVDVVAGRDTILDLTAATAETAATARISADSATLLTAWRDSVVEIWTPTAHASGFVIDSQKGLIATSHRALGGATALEVQLTAGKERLKVPGRVIVSERDPGAAIVWINPQAIGSIRGIDMGCANASRPEVNYKDVLTTITASMFANKEVSDGIVSRVTPQAIFSAIRIGSDSEGGPVFAENGTLLGITAIDNDKERGRWSDAWVIPADRACGAVASAGKLITDSTPPPDTRLPLETFATSVQTLKGPRQDAKAGPKTQPSTLPAANFDLTLMTPAQVQNITPGVNSMRGDFGTWSEYLREIGPALLVRVSPQFEESVWKMLARGAASTQGVALPPLKSFTSNFLRLRAYCGDAEVTPIHPFIIEHEVQGRSKIREGLYVFERDAFGPHCPTVRFSMFSEREPEKADTKTIDPKLFEQLKP
jgi:S1-C subfamily serine protease